MTHPDFFTKLERIRKLKALADNNPNENEAKVARLRAQRLAQELGVDYDTLMIKAVQVRRENKLPPGVSKLFAGIGKAYPGTDDEDYSRKKKSD